MENQIKWPNDHDFAFTIFDDTDFVTLKNIKPIYSFLNDIGLKTTKSVWTLKSKVKNPYVTGPASELLEYRLDKENKDINITSKEKKTLERKWFFEKIFKGFY